MNLSKSRIVLLVALAFSFQLCCNPPVYSQAASGQPSKAASSAWNPTKPEVQPPLNVDRDPIPLPTAPPSAKPKPKPSSASASANSGAPVKKNKNGMYIYRTNVDEVLLNCTVIDNKGHTVTGLTKRDFRVWENGVPQVINSVEPQDSPVSIGLLIDNSGSMRGKRAAVNAAAYKFLLDSNPQDEDFVVNFSTHAFLDQGFTTSLTALHRGLSRFDSKGETALYDTVVASADELSKYGKQRDQVLVIITDGADDASHLTLQQAIHRVQALGGPVVYAIGLTYDNSKSEAARARKALEELTQQTGGVAYFPPSLQDVGAVAAEVARDIREQYVIDYHSSDPFSLGGYRTVRVEAAAPHHGKLSVRTRSGYYVRPGQRTMVKETAKR